MDPSTFDAPEMAEALAEATNGASAPCVSRVDEESSKRARDLGWVPPQTYDYGASAPTAAKKPEIVEDEEENNESQHKGSTWAHDAAKYEWNQEYGDVGPRSEALEKELFKGDFINRAGEKLAK
jgi:ATP-dependent RNA helicase DDX3X